EHLSPWKRKSLNLLSNLYLPRILQENSQLEFKSETLLGDSGDEANVKGNDEDVQDNDDEPQHADDERNSENQKTNVAHIRRICAYTSLKTTKEQDLIRRIQSRPIHRIQVIEGEYSGRYQTWSLLQEIPNTPYPISLDTVYRPVSRLYKYKSLNSVLGMEVVRYKEFGELIQPFKDPERVSQLDRKLLKTTLWKKRLQETMTELTLEESLSMFMTKIAKRIDENTNLIKELQASTDFALRNQAASIKALKIQVRQMSIELHEKLSRDLRSSTVIKPRVDDETISTSVETDKPSICRIDASQYALLGKALPRKEKDLGSFTLACFIKNMCYKALADLGASVSVMPYSIYTTLGLGDLIPTKLIIELADRTVKRPKGIVENVLVGIDKFTFPGDFIILDIPEGFKTPLILIRHFLSTAYAIINVFKAKITLSVGNDKIFFKSNKPNSNIIKRVYALSLIESTKLGLETRLMGNELRKNKSQDPKFMDFIELNDLNEPIEHRRNQVKVFVPTIEEGEGMYEPIIEDIETKFDNIGYNEDECKYLGFYNFCHP
ncbi:reverse transcriptase domain-containing protein, partial [Tanacetum coccineum]